MKTVLNIGGNNREIKMLDFFETEEWRQVLLDIDPNVDPDLQMDARHLLFYNEKFDAVYCSHNLEHFNTVDIPKVTHGAYHVLKDNGFAIFRVPDIKSVMAQMVENDHELEDVCYTIGEGASAIPIHYGDVIYGWQRMMEHTGNDFFAHKWGFSVYSLSEFLKHAGFRIGGVWKDGHEITIMGVK